MPVEASKRLERLERLVPVPGAPLPDAVYRELEHEHDDDLAALDELALKGLQEQALRLATLLWRFWMDSGRLEQGRRRLEGLLEAAVDAPSVLRAQALYGAGTLAFRQGDNEAARSLHEQSLACAREAGDAVAEATARLGLARCGLRDGDLNASREHARAAERIYRDLGDEAALDGPLHVLAYADYVAGDDDRARAGFEQTLALNRRLGNGRNIARARHARAEPRRGADDPRRHPGAAPGAGAGRGELVFRLQRRWKYGTQNAFAQWATLRWVVK